MIKTTSLFTNIVFAHLLIACAHQSLSGVSENTLDVTPNITLAGSLADQAPQLIKRHNAIVIDLRHPSEGIDPEAQNMRALGVSYFNLPVTPNTLNSELVNKFDTLLTEHTGHPIVVHCQSGNRAGLLWAALLKERGESSAAANAAVADIVTKAGIRKVIQAYTINREN